MSKGALSGRAKFRDAIVLSTEWSNMAGQGECELALLKGKRSVQVWHWTDVYASAERMPLGRLSSWRDAIERLALSDLATCIVAERVRVSGTPRYIGQILAMAWCDDEGLRQAARILCRFPDGALASIDAKRRGAFDAKLQDALTDALKRLEEAMLELDDLPDELDLSSAKPAALKSAINQVLKEHKRLEADAERKQLLDNALLSPWRKSLDELERRWRLRRPSRRYPGGGELPPVGLVQLMGYAKRHVLDHGVLPAGVHTISGTANALGGVVAALTVNFDELLGPIDAKPDSPK